MKFKPVKITITLKTQDELNALYAVANAASLDIEKAVKDGQGEGTISGTIVDFNEYAWYEVSGSIYNKLSPLVKKTT